MYVVSVYPDLRPLSEIKEYLELASGFGVTHVFSSMFSVEGTNEEICAYFKDLDETAHSFGMKVILDVNPEFMKKLNASYDDVSLFQEIGCDILRMDLSFGAEKDYILANNPYGIGVMLNASMGVEKELQYFAEKGLSKDKVTLGHNFYPQRYTGLKWQSFLDTNANLHKYGHRINAFISSQAEGTHGVWDATDGLPTVEMMRDYPMDLQARLLLATGNVDDICIGNAYASEEEFRAVAQILQPQRDLKDSPLAGVFPMALNMEMPEKKLRIAFSEGCTEREKNLVLNFFPHMDFGDSSEWIWRSRNGRFLYNTDPIKARDEDCEQFAPGDVLVVNERYAHYSGEVQIARLPMINDGTRNLVGRLCPHESELLKLVNDGDEVRFLAD